MEVPLNGFDILALVLVANALTLWWLSGFWRLSKTDKWDWYSIFACGVPGLIALWAMYQSVWFNSLGSLSAEHAVNAANPTSGGPAGPTHRYNPETGEIEEITLPDVKSFKFYELE